MKSILPQQCPMVFLYITWLAYVAGLLYFPLSGEYTLAVAWLIGLPAALWIYVRNFPHISHLLGYGRVDDVAASEPAETTESVRMYSSVGCPFCPLVEKRLRGLQASMGFELHVVDVTLKPDVVRGKKIRAVPVIEVGDRRHVGHATTQQLAELIEGAS